MDDLDRVLEERTMLRRQNHQSALDYAKAKIHEYKEKLIDIEDMIEDLVHRGDGSWLDSERPMYKMLRAIEDQLNRLLKGKHHQVWFVEKQNKDQDEDEAWFNWHSNPDNDPEGKVWADHDENDNVTRGINLCSMPLKVLS